MIPQEWKGLLLTVKLPVLHFFPWRIRLVVGGMIPRLQCHGIMGKVGTRKTACRWVGLILVGIGISFTIPMIPQFTTVFLITNTEMATMTMTITTTMTTTTTRTVAEPLRTLAPGHDNSDDDDEEWDCDFFEIKPLIGEGIPSDPFI